MSATEILCLASNECTLQRLPGSQCSWTNRPIQCCGLTAVYHTASNVLALGSQIEALFLEAKELVGHVVELADTGLGFECSRLQLLCSHSLECEKEQRHSLSAQDHAASL